MEHDQMISVHEVPWHGLGIILPEYIPALEVQAAANLTWKVTKEELFSTINGKQVKIPSFYSIVRDDINLPLGVVGDTYEPFQNDQMFEFMDSFCSTTGAKIETAGSLRNGKIVWALATAGETEYVKNDPVNQYFLFKNSFDGGSSVNIAFTNVRVVCNNTLTMALNGASNMWKVNHTSAMLDKIETAKKTVFLQHKNAQAMAQAMDKMIAYKMTEEMTVKAVQNIVARELKDIIDKANNEAAIVEATKHTEKTTNKILELCETGAGADIPGVRGTAYGVLNACTEYADHYKTVRRTDGRTEAETRFESIIMGGARYFKDKAFNYLYAMAA